jgi:hypothetical protein
MNNVLTSRWDAFAECVLPHEPAIRRSPPPWWGAFAERVLLVSLCAAVLLPSATPAGPYAPAAGEPGSTAVAWDDPRFIAWASGWTNYMPGADDRWKDPSQGTGPADAWDASDPSQVVSLGGGGRLTLTFPVPVADGPGDDFVVFENAVTDEFLEFAYVEVSSDSTNYYRFPCASLTSNAVGNYGSVDPTDVDGLAGKYRAGHGVPFDLAVLRGRAPGLDFRGVSHVRLIDIPGNGSCTDSVGRAIYDAYPTTGSPGFDLDAIGVLNVPDDARIDATPGGPRIRWTAYTNALYQAQWNADVTDTNGWQNLGAAVTGDNLSHEVADAGASGAARRFYRVLRQTPVTGGGGP